MKKILIVEDDDLIRDMVMRRLRRRGYDVAVATDGVEGVARAKAEAPELILMDMSLPLKHGWDATRELKADPETKGIPVIALTAHAMAGDREKAIEAGCDEYEAKPVDLPSLLRKMEQLLRS